MWSKNLSGVSRDSSSDAALQNVATYIEDYIDLVENVPNEVVRQVSVLHEHNHQFHLKLDALESAIKNFKSSEGSCEKKRKQALLARIQRALVGIQQISDEKLSLTQSINDELDTKARQLDQDYRNIVAGGGNNIISPVKAVREASFASGFSRMELANNHSSSHQSNGVQHQKKEEPIESTKPSSQEVPNENSNIATLPANSKATLTPSNSNYTLDSARDDEDDADEETETVSHVNGSRNSSPPTGKRPSRRNVQTISKPAKEQHVEKVEKIKKDTTANNNTSTNDRLKTTSTNSPVKSNRGGKRPFSKANKEPKRSRRDANSPPPSVYEENHVDPDEPTYCLCEQVSFGEMIGCDNDNCRIEWFHFQCVQLTTKPKGKWYCPQCRGDRPNVPKK